MHLIAVLITSFESKPRHVRENLTGYICLYAYFGIVVLLCKGGSFECKLEVHLHKNTSFWWLEDVISGALRSKKAGMI